MGTSSATRIRNIARHIRLGLRRDVSGNHCIRWRFALLYGHKVTGAISFGETPLQGASNHRILNAVNTSTTTECRFAGTVLQSQLRHADVKTTLRVYARAIPESQRVAMERASLAIGAEVPISTVSGNCLKRVGRGGGDRTNAPSSVPACKRLTSQRFRKSSLPRNYR